MTEEEWLKCDDPRPLLEFVRRKTSDRKLRLFACGCCRRIWHLLDKEQFQNAVLAAEQFVDGIIKRKELRYAADLAAAEIDFDNDTIRSNQPAGAAFICAVPKKCSDYDAYDQLEYSAIDAAYHAADGLAFLTGLEAAQRSGNWDQELYKAVRERTAREEGVGQSHLVRDVFGNPFQPPAFDPAWRTRTAVALAEGMYASRDFGAMPILADALQDAGCDNEDMLNHCRDTTAPHTRGCWVVDLVLGKE